MRGNVAVASGDLYPNGITLIPANPAIQASVRPEGSYFVKSAGYETIRPGKSRFQHSHGMGIHFTPQRFAEDVDVLNALPMLVDATTSGDHVDIADLPGSENLDSVGNLSPQEVRANQGVKMSETDKMAPTGGIVEHRGTKTLPDMGDREPGRPISAMFHGLLRNPAGAFRDEYAKDPIIAVGAAALIVGLVYAISRDFERSYRSRSRAASRGGGVVASAAPVAAVPVAATDTAGEAVEKVADTTANALTEVADAGAAIVETAGEAAEKVAETVGDAVTGKED